jgi:hypothetical protein
MKLRKMLREKMRKKDARIVSETVLLFLVKSKAARNIPSKTPMIRMFIM